VSDIFVDHFSAAAAAYSRYRPNYPEALYERIDNDTEAHGRAWDCATGSGQALEPLIRRFDRIVASDASVAQLSGIIPHPKVLPVAARAECMPLATASMDLVTIAQALHWFATDDFYGELRRILRPHGTVAAWTYDLCRVDADVDRVMAHFYRASLGPYWPSDRRHVETAYATLPWPFREQSVERLTMAADWTVEQLLAYVGTWSAVQRMRQANRGRDPLASFATDLRAVWGDVAQRRVTWPLTLKIARAG